MVKLLRAVGMGGISLLGALAAGILIGSAGMPAVKKGLRGLAVRGVAAALTAGDILKHAGARISEKYQTGKDVAAYCRDAVQKAEKGHQDMADEDVL